VRKITVDKIDKGMILAEDICGNTGNVLLSNGTQLNGAIGRRLKNWGITEVCIEGDASASIMDTDTEHPAEDIHALLREKFKGVLDSEHMQVLFKAVLAFRTRQG